MVGCGIIGWVHAHGLGKMVEDGEVVPVAAADPSAEGRDRVAGVCGFGRFLDDGATLAADEDVEAVLITAPTTAHADLVRSALAAGKPLLCEKPLATRFELVRELTGEVRDSGLVAQVGFNSRYHPLYNALAGIVQRTELGRPMAYTLRDDQYWPTGDVVPGHSSWRSDVHQAGGGALLEHSIHSVDILNWLFGPASRVYALTRNVFGYGVEDTATLTLEHENGVVGNLVTIFNSMRGREERRLEVFFEHGVVELTTDFVIGAKEDSLLVQRPDQAPDRLDVTALREEFFSGLGVSRRDVFFYQYVSDRAWLASVRARTPATPGFADAFAAHAVVEAAYRSAISRQPVDLVEDLAFP